MPALTTLSRRVVASRLGAACPIVQSINRQKLGIIAVNGSPARGLSGPSEFVPQFPTEKQAAFLALDCKEAMYGGAAGGGKSSALLMAALQYVGVPGYAALIFRRTYADLSRPDGLMSRAREWLLPTRAVWNEQKKTWYFPSGATLTFGYIDNDNDLKNYQGGAYQFIGYDELTHFPERWYKYLFSRLRRLASKTNVPLRMRSATNPGGIGHAWVKARFVEDAKPIIGQFVFSPGTKGRCYVPAKLSDNPYLDAESYRENLEELDPVELAQLLNGDWDVAVGGTMFKREWFNDKIVNTEPTNFLRMVRRWDLAASEPTAGYPDPDYTVGIRACRTPTGIYVCHMERLRKLPGDVEAKVISLAKADGKRTAIRLEQEPGSAGKSVIHDFIRKLVGYDIEGKRSTGDKSSRAKPASAQCQVGNVYLVKGEWNEPFLAELEAFGVNCTHDDIVDAFSGVMQDLSEEKDKTAVTG